MGGSLAGRSPAVKFREWVRSRAASGASSRQTRVKGAGDRRWITRGKGPWRTGGGGRVGGSWGLVAGEAGGVDMEDPVDIAGNI